MGNNLTTPSASYQITVAAKKPLPIPHEILQLSAHGMQNTRD